MQYRIDSFLPSEEGIMVQGVIESTEYKILDNKEWGTFKDSLRSPIHNWFPYPAGFSNRAVEHAIRKFSITQEDFIYDPFAGTGTTNIVAKTLGINSVGIEAHPFIYFVAKTKTYWDYDVNKVVEGSRQIEALARKIATDVKQDQWDLKAEFPELVYKCFSANTLRHLYAIREAIRQSDFVDSYRDFFNLALTCILRPVANVATGWPYIAPSKKKHGADKDVYATFSEMVLKMYGDIRRVATDSASCAACTIINGDARDTTDYIEDNTVDFIFTSPPYLNNYDYADRTRLETYFFGWAKDWGEISDKVRTQLIMSATTQINRGRYQPQDILSADLKLTAPYVACELQSKIDQLSQLRLTKGGKKSYDILVGGYFNDMFRVLKDCYRVLKSGSYCVLILGDSAPYGIHVPTEVVLGDIGKAIGFSNYEIEVLRGRGDKWKGNPQRHKIALRESILYLRK